jgi:DNA-binding beta-propeller fold protein YncE
MIKVAVMKIQLRVLTTALLTAGCTVAAAQQKPAAAPQPAQASPQATLAQRAEVLTQEQITASHDMASLSKLASLYNSIGDTKRFAWTLKRLTELLPDSGQLRLQLAMAYAEQGDKTNAYDTLVHMQGQGFAYDVSTDPRFEKIHGTKVWDYIVTNLQVNAKQFGEGKTAFELPKGDYLFESIGYDPKRKQFLVGSAREGKVYLADKSGKISEFIQPTAENGLYAVFDMAVDAAHDKLYVASAGVPYYKGFTAESFGKSGIVEFQLSTGKYVNKYTFPADTSGLLPTSMTVGKDGHVYVADGDHGVIFRLDGGELKHLAQNPKLTSIRGMAVSDDGRTLYFADYAMAIFGIDLTKDAPFGLGRNPEKLVLGGIVGMYWYDGCLIVIESGMVPQRVMRLKLTEDGRSVKAAMPLDVAQPAFATPTLGAIVGDELYFIANSQKMLYDKFGVLKEPTKLEPTQIFRSNLRFAWDQSGIAGGVSELPKGTARKGSNSPPSSLAPADAKPPEKDEKH